MHRQSVKYHFLHRPYTQWFLHWGWILLGMALMGTVFYYLMRPWTESTPRMSLHIQEPHFYSISRNGHPYHIHAQSIQLRSSGQFSFLQPWAEYDFFDQKITVSSHMGQWNDALQRLTLEKKIHIQDTQGQHIYTDFAEILYQKKEIKSHKPTTGISPKGRFKSNGFTWSNQALHLHGPVTMTLHTQNLRQ